MLLARLILLALLVAIVLIAVTSVMALFGGGSGRGAPDRSATEPGGLALPHTARTIALAALILLMLGITLGLIGGPA